MIQRIRTLNFLKIFHVLHMEKEFQCAEQSFYPRKFFTVTSWTPTVCRGGFEAHWGREEDRN
jgi:hypothetical protein